MANGSDQLGSIREQVILNGLETSQFRLTHIFSHECLERKKKKFLPLGKSRSKLFSLKCINLDLVMSRKSSH